MYQEQFIGAQVAAWRRRRGMSQRVLAGLAGISQPYLSQIETGSRPVERRSTLVALAEALQVSVVELLGGPEVASDSAQARAAVSVPAIRAAIIRRRVGETRPSVGAGVDAAVAAITAADYVALGPMLPGLIGSATGPDLVRVGYAAMWYLNHMGYVDLACGVADLALAEAQRDGSAAWLGIAEYVRACSLPPETALLSAELAGRAADDLLPAVADPAVRQAYGMLHLRAASKAAAAGDASVATAHLDEAASEAATLGEPEDGHGLCSLAFGPTNVAMWRTAVHVELGKPDAAISAAQRVDPRRTPIPHRQAWHWMSLGRALAGVKRDDDAVMALLRAETACPQWVRLRPEVRDTVNVILRRSHRRAIPAPLRRAAQMVGIEVK
jgi:transcriptional regulator with XRE-family HTH domain